MYTRVVTLTGVQDIDALAAYVQDTALPGLRAQKGYKGFSVSADRASGLVGTMSIWETEADRDASDSALAKLREDAKGQFASDMKVETFEEQVVEIARRPEAGSRLMVTRISMDPAKVDENLEAFKQEVLPQIKAAPGFRTLRNMMNAQGEGIVGSIWDDEQSMQAASERAMARRSEGEARGVNFGETSFREIIFMDMP